MIIKEWAETQRKEAIEKAAEVYPKLRVQLFETLTLTTLGLGIMLLGVIRHTPVLTIFGWVVYCLGLFWWVRLGKLKGRFEGLVQKQQIMELGIQIGEAMLREKEREEAK